MGGWAQIDIDKYTQAFSKYKKKIKDYKSELLRNNSLIQVTDFGAGSRVFSSDERKVSKNMNKRIDCGNKNERDICKNKNVRDVCKNENKRNCCNNKTETCASTNISEREIR